MNRWPQLLVRFGTRGFMGASEKADTDTQSLFVECRYFEHGGEVLVYLKAADGEGVFAYARQVENGTIKLECCRESSYAHVTKNGAVFRHNEMIGTLADFLPDATGGGCV